MEISQKKLFKFSLGILFCILFRLIPFRPPNIEPILASQMPFSKIYGPFYGIFFAFFSMILFDLFTGHFGSWSWWTAGAYGILGYFAFYFFKKKEPSRWDYVTFAVIGTLFFDIVTGLLIGPILFHQSFIVAVVGQIPFTLWHLAGNISFSLTISPIISSYLVQKQKTENYYHTIQLEKKII